MTNIVILAAGSPAFETSDGDYPLCLTEFDGTPLIQRLINNCAAINAGKLIVALRDAEVSRYHLDNAVRQLADDAHTVRVSQTTRGAACTALLAAEHIDNDDELLIVSANELIDVDLVGVVSAFRAAAVDAGAVVFHSIHPRYSFVRVDADGFVIEAAEKNPISNHATAGLYWFRKGSDFVRGAKTMIRKGADVDGLFYVCPVFNQLILEQKRIATFPIRPQQYHPLKSERHFRQFDATLESRA
ncbi:glycosyltransferase family 2 protein [Paraburkholderia caballeronis]|uniref:MobA-like NTP transferase domain-containing protein n=1 Tax=Paraburkholderia caballeronis TaxID=416943 RepID=A0A1H7H8K0_9BURK|nr:glycosyltransferase family 2 protein [Paraburkholderia caballeronis]PXW29604.1 MobA-like NTP transferase protein [Paraburkholderia caballeronis]PXX04863.1 MobA-like NTP transferase protein [Paraburkholderia caballeronis]RAK05924.1 MobA-like NTP transferase protein [Paraburkholderia caballeronis]TDV11124.1 MobA-like NTP transferase protein [Paraburkholderia caballeronis]TDV14186.1 MobA-like NTP transferase protein [Paraburkholderia caballeronis]